jgi:hypothetical protein
MSDLANDIEHELIRLALEAQRDITDWGDRFRPQWVRRLRETARTLDAIADALETTGNAIPVIEPIVKDRRNAA